MSADIHMVAHDDRSREILDELEKRTEVRPYLTSESGERRYYLPATKAETDAFDAMLDRIDTGWRDHISRTP